MSFNQAVLDTAYTNKDGKLTAYGLGKISTAGKFVLAKLGKVSDNGIGLQFCAIASSGMISAVSNSAKEKGVKAIEIFVGDTILIAVNAQTKKKDFKTQVEGDSPEKKVIETFATALEHHKIMCGELFLIQCDFMAIPATGWSKKVLNGWMKDTDQIDDEGFTHPLLIKKFANKEEFDAIILEQGYDIEAWSKAYETLDGSVLEERQQYSKKDFGTSLAERLAAIKAITPDIRKEIMVTCNLLEADGTELPGYWTTLCYEWLKSV